MADLGRLSLKALSLKAGALAALTLVPLCLVGMAAVPHLYKRALAAELLQQRDLADGLSRRVARAADPNAVGQGKVARDVARSHLILAPTESTAAAWLQTYLAEAVRHRSGEVQQMQVVAQQPAAGQHRVAVRVNAQISSDGLRDLLLEIETGKPFLFVEELRVQAPTNDETRPDETVGPSPLTVEIRVGGVTAARR